jgi:asparagine synthase (glutamine-hydrolysing)
VPDLLGRLDQPVADPALVALSALAEFARPTITVAIGGEGADEIFGGYPRYRWLYRSALLDRRLPRWAARGGTTALEHLPLGRAGRLRDVVRPAPLLERHVDWVTDGRRALRSRVYGPRLRAYEAESALLDPARVGSDGVVGGFMRLDQLQWLPDDVLVKADRASMRASLELRTPYLSRELAEFAATVPARVHIAGGGKLLLRRVLAAVLPEAANERAKVAFRTPVRDWLSGPLAGAFDDQLASSAVYEQGWFERDEIRRLYAEHCSGARDRSDVLWPVFAFSLWLDRFVSA